MTFDPVAPYFNMTIAACRAAGSRGGRISGMNRALRKLAASPAAPDTEVQIETAHEANMLLDAQFPWLRGAELRNARRARA